MEKYFFDLPVYRLSKEAYYSWKTSKLINPRLENWREITGNEMPAHQKMFWEQHYYERYGPWDFNEVVAYVRLHFLGSQIRGEYFSAEKKRNPVRRKKVFTFRTHKLAAEVNIRVGKIPTNQEIWENIQSYVERCRNELNKGRILDTSHIETIGPHMDWRGLLGWD